MKKVLLSLALTVFSATVVYSQDTSNDSLVIYLEVTLSDGKTIQLYTGDSIVNKPPAVAVVVKSKSVNVASSPRIKSFDLIIIDHSDFFNEPADYLIESSNGAFSDRQLSWYNRLNNVLWGGKYYDMVWVKNCRFEDSIRRHTKLIISKDYVEPPPFQEPLTTFTWRGMRVFAETDTPTHIHQSEEGVKCFYKTSQGRLDGPYSSYYQNGIKKSEGTFQDNYRTGVWSVWDSTGTLRMQREYSNPFTFKTIFPIDTPTRFNTTIPYKLSRGETGVYEYFYVHGRMVVWQLRMWRDLVPEHNAVLFENDLLFNTLIDAVNTNADTAFQDDRFSEPFTNSIDTALYDVVAFRIKEDWFFENERLLAETRQIGICPVVVNKNTSDTIDLCWFYYPGLRTILAKQSLNDDTLPAAIKNLDDIFFFHYYYGQIYKESNVFDREIRDYATGEGIAKEAETIELYLIEQEHDLWISYTK